MINIISLEKILIELIKILKNKHSKQFADEIFKILNTKNIILNNNTITNNVKNINICNYPRTRNRGPCKRRCIDKYCVFHIKNNYVKKDNPNNHIPNKKPNELPCKLYEENESVPKYDKILPYRKITDNKQNTRQCIYMEDFIYDQINSHKPNYIPNKDVPKNNFILQLLDYNDLDENDNYNEIILSGDIKNNYNKCIYIEDIPDKPNLLVKNNIPDNNKNTPIIKKTKKKKSRYIREYNILCKFYDLQIKSKINKYNICIRTKFLLNDVLNYEKNKTQNKDYLSDRLKNSLNIISKNEDLEDLHIDIMHLVSYMYTLGDAIKTDNYDNKDLLDVKECI
jgi:hypothetical protein